MRNADCAQHGFRHRDAGHRVSSRDWRRHLHLRRPKCSWNGIFVWDVKGSSRVWNRLGNSTPGWPSRIGQHPEGWYRSIFEAGSSTRRWCARSRNETGFHSFTSTGSDCWWWLQTSPWMQRWAKDRCQAEDQLVPQWPSAQFWIKDSSLPRIWSCHSGYQWCWSPWSGLASIMLNFRCRYLHDLK